MCDYSIKASKSRPAKVGERLRVHNFGYGTRGFTATDDRVLGETAVCVLPGTELAFDSDVLVYGAPPGPSVAVFGQRNKDCAHTHHDMLEFADGRQVLLTWLHEGQEATVLQLPAAPKTEAEVEAQKRVEYVG